MKINLYLVVAAAATPLLVPLTVSATDKSGTIVNETWTTNNSPYRVVGDIQVSRLTIQSGVTVVFASNYVFEIAGRIKAIGTPDLPILFTTTNAGWQGLFFNGGQPGSELAHCIIEKSLNSGIRIVNTSPTISDCVIRSNSVLLQANGGGGSLSREADGGGIRTDSPLLLDNCVIRNNSVTVVVTADNAGATAKGGGVYSTAPLILLNCNISSNSISAMGRGYFSTSSPASASQGAGVWSATNLVLQNCLVKGNFANADSTVNNLAGASAVSSGGGIWCSGQATQRNSIITANTGAANASPFSGQIHGSGIFVNDSSTRIENCTVAFNTTEGLATGANMPVVLNSIFWGNGGNQVVGTTNITYSDMQGGYSGTGNINGNPIFLSADDPIIVDGSPCMNAGSTNAAYRDLCFPPSLHGSRNDMGAHGGPGACARFRVRLGQQFEVVLLGGVPGYNYAIEASTNLSDWEIVQPFQVAHLGDAVYFLEQGTNTLPQRYYRLNLQP